jgi:preprotein translocase subunit SecD
VVVLLPTEADRRRVERLLARPGTLEFRILANPDKDKTVIERARKDPSKTEVLDAAGKRLAWWVPVNEGQEKNFADNTGTVRRTRKQDHREVTEVLVVADPQDVTGAYLTKAEVGADTSGPCINFTFNAAGGKRFAKLTGDHLPDASGHSSYRLGIILDGELCSAPTIRSVISNQGKITGRFTPEEAAEIAETLNAGSLPVRIRVVPKTAVKASEKGAEKAPGIMRALRL